LQEGCKKFDLDQKQKQTLQTTEKHELQS